MSFVFVNGAISFSLEKVNPFTTLEGDGGTKTQVPLFNRVEISSLITLCQFGDLKAIEKHVSSK